MNLHIDVKPARLTIIYLLGQSNMEGMCSWNTGYDNDENILNTAGTVYSTYLPTATNPSNYMTDISGQNTEQAIMRTSLCRSL